MSFSRIYDIREENELTQNDLAKITGGSRVNISKWEREKEIPNIKKMNTISNYFNISLDYIFNLTNIKWDNKIKKINIDKNLVGQRIILVRKNNNLTQRELAKILNTTSSTISAYEQGKTLILTAFAIEICKKYHVSMDWLYGKKDI